MICRGQLLRETAARSKQECGRIGGLKSAAVREAGRGADTAATGASKEEATCASAVSTLISREEVLRSVPCAHNKGLQEWIVSCMRKSPATKPADHTKALQLIVYHAAAMSSATSVASASKVGTTTVIRNRRLLALFLLLCKRRLRKRAVQSPHEQLIAKYGRASVTALR